MEFNATDEQLDFPIVYGIAREGKATLSLDQEGTSIQPLLETVLKQCSAYEGNEEDPLQMQVSSLDYESYIGRLGIGRVTRGKNKNGQTVALSKNDGSDSSFRISKLFVSEGIKRVEKDVAFYGDIVIFAGCPVISIGDTVCD